MAGSRVTESEAGNRGNSEDWVAQQVRQGNPWYLGSQFEWAERPSIRRIYQERYKFFRDCIGRVQKRIGRPLRALDLGCGDGYWLWRLADLADVEWTGLDYNPVRVERARQAAPNADVRQGDVDELDPGGLFDVVLLNQVIEHVSDDVGALVANQRLDRGSRNADLGHAPTRDAGFSVLRPDCDQRAPQRTTCTSTHEPVIPVKRIQRAGFVVEGSHARGLFRGKTIRSIYWLTSPAVGDSACSKASRAYFPASAAITISSAASRRRGWGDVSEWRMDGRAGMKLRRLAGRVVCGCRRTQW